jgi:radical SAM superfamily enzyme YgiQ (UPF0313 family)
MGITGVINNLIKNGISVKGINIPLKKKIYGSFELVSALSNYNPKIVLIDVHWYVHIKNSLEIAKICKRFNCIVIVGGLSATIFYKQLLKIDEIDYVVKGDAEKPLLNLVKDVLKKRKVKKMPNIASKKVDNEIKYTCTDIDKYDYTSLDFLEDAESYINMFDFWLMIGKGCPFDCEICDGSKLTTSGIFHRQKTILRKVKNIIHDLTLLRSETVNLSLDLSLLSDEAIKEISKNNFNLNLRNDFYQLADIDKLRQIKNSFRSFEIVFSPVSGDEEERKKYGKNFSNQDFLENLRKIEQDDINGGIIIYFTDYMLSPFKAEKLNVKARNSLIKEIGKVSPNALIRILPQVVDPGTIDVNKDKLFRLYSS